MLAVLAVFAYLWLSPSLPESASELDGVWRDGDGMILSLGSYEDDEKSPLAGNMGTDVNSAGEIEVDDVLLRLSGRCRFSDNGGGTVVFGEFVYTPKTQRLIVFQFGPDMPRLYPVVDCRITSFRDDKMTLTMDDGGAVQLARKRNE